MSNDHDSAPLLHADDSAHVELADGPAGSSELALLRAQVASQAAILAELLDGRGVAGADMPPRGTVALPRDDAPLRSTLLVDGSGGFDASPATQSDEQVAAMLQAIEVSLAGAAEGRASVEDDRDVVVHPVWGRFEAPTAVRLTRGIECARIAL